MQNEDCALAISQGMQIFVALAKFHRAANIRSLANFMLLFFYFLTPNLVLPKLSPCISVSFLYFGNLY